MGTLAIIFCRAVWLRDSPADLMAVLVLLARLERFSQPRLQILFPVHSHLICPPLLAPAVPWDIVAAIELYPMHGVQQGVNVGAHVQVDSRCKCSH